MGLDVGGAWGAEEGMVRSVGAHLRLGRGAGRARPPADGTVAVGLCVAASGGGGWDALVDTWEMA